MNDKKLIEYKYVYLGAWLLLSLLSACTTKKQETALPTSGMALPATATNSEQAESDRIAIEPETELTDSIAQKLFLAIPSIHGLNALQPEHLERLTEKMRRYLLEYAATDTVHLGKYEMPWFSCKYIIKEIDDAYYLCFSQTEGKDSVKINYVLDDPYNHRRIKNAGIRIKTELENGRWKVADFLYDGKWALEYIKSEITDRRIMFRTPEFRKWIGKKIAYVDKYLNEYYPDSISIAEPHRTGFFIEGNSDLAERITASGLTEEWVDTLYRSISSYAYQQKPKEIFGPRLLPLVEEALAIPEDDLEEGLSFKVEWLASLDLDYETATTTTPITFKVTPFNEDSVSVETERISMLDGGQWEIVKPYHVMHLTNHGGHWLISTMTNENDLSRYISNMRKFFRSEEWTNECIRYAEEIEQQTDSVKKVQMQEHLQNLKELVKEYFEKYPEKE